MKFFIENPNIQYTKMVTDLMGGEIVDTINDSEVVIFTGGEDVSPYMYSDSEPHPSTYYSVQRDNACVDLFNNSVGKLRIGICRGAQFLHVMNGGQLVQDCDQHGIYGMHEITLIPGMVEGLVTSTHHQMMLYDYNLGDSILVGWANRSTYKEVMDGGKPVDIKDRQPEDAEVVYYPWTNSLCFQPHPEYAVDDPKYMPCFDIFKWCLKNYMDIN